MWQEIGLQRTIKVPRKSESLNMSKQRTMTIKRHAVGTPPDTSLHLGSERRAWLKYYGGIQPVICRLIDAARSSPYPTSPEPSMSECEANLEGRKAESGKEG
jgi:hypothetical protein